MKRFTSAITVVALLLILVVAGCAKPTPSPAPQPTPTPKSSPAPKLTSSPAPSPAQSPKPSPSAPAPAGKATSAEEFFKNKSIDLMTPSSPGGAGDYAARLFATYWSGATGSVKMLVVNQPGGGGMVGMNAIYNAKPDGLTLGLTSLGGRIMGPTAFPSPGMKYDAGKFSYIGSFAAEPETFAIGAKLPYASISELQKAKGLKFGAAEKGSSTTIGMSLICYLGGLDAKLLIPSTTAETGLYIARGEMDGEAWKASSIKEHAAKGWVKPLLTMDLIRSKAYPDIPSIPEAFKLSPDQEKLVEVWALIVRPGQVVFGPPGIPEDRLKFLRDSFGKVMTTEGFRKTGEDRWGSFETPLTGQEVAAQVAKLATAPKEQIAKLSEIIEKYTTTK